MANLKELRTKKGSVENTRKVTQAMQLLSAIKSKKLLATLAEREIYIAEIKKTIQLILSQGVSVDHPLLQKSISTQKKAAVFVVATNRGFVGAQLTHLAKLLVNRANELSKGDSINYIGVKPTATKVFTLAGKKPTQLFNISCDENVFELAGMLKVEILQMVKAGKANHIELLYTSFHSFSNLTPTSLVLAPLHLDLAEQKPEDKIEGSFTFDDSPESLLSELVEIYLEATLSHALLSAAVSEYAARMLAMHKAKENAEQVLSTTVKAYNRARQSAITTQIQEIANTQLITLATS
jgi:F-type H+-transporting ATPase subunit gamma